MEQIFISVLNRSLTAAYCVVVVLCIRMCIRRFPKVYSYALWLVVFVRFAVPFSLESVHSIVRVSSRVIPADIGLKQTPHIETGIGQLDYAANRILAWSLPQTNAAASVNPMQVVLSVAAWIWLAVASVLAACWVFSYLRLKRRLKDAVWMEGEIWTTDKMSVPFVMGILKPRIYLPIGLSEKERACVIRHEQVHVRRRDYLIKQLAYGIVCFHWFNPMAWIALWLMCCDMEMSCDEAVLKHSGLDGEQGLLYKKEYAAALLTLACGRSVWLSGPLFFGMKNVKGRIQNVLAFRRQGTFMTYVSVILILLAAVGLMGSRKIPLSDDQDEICARLKAEGYTDVCWISEECWAGIEGLAGSAHAYPVIAASDAVWESGSGERYTICAALYCFTEDGLKVVGTLDSSSTAMPLCYDKTGIYCGSHQMGNRCTINTETWTCETAEWVSVDYYEDPEGAYYYGLGDVVRKSTKEEWDAFWDGQFLAAEVMEFEALPDAFE